MIIDKVISDFKENAKSFSNIGYPEHSMKYQQAAEWLEDYKRLLKKKINRPVELYAIEEISSGKIIFNARGGAYKDKELAIRKLNELGSCSHRLVIYKLLEN